MRGRRDDSASSGDRAPAGPHGPAIGKHTRVESLSDPSVQRFMAAGQLAPERPEGRELLAHEIAHTAQADQHGGPAQAAAKRDGDPTEAAETEADTFAAQFREDRKSVV